MTRVFALACVLCWLGCLHSVARAQTFPAPPVPPPPPSEAGAPRASAQATIADDAAPAAPPAPTPAELAARADATRAALARYAHEPDVAAVVRAALAVLPAGHASALASRARDAGWIPTLGLRARRGQGVDWSQTLGEQAIDVGSDDDLTLEASLTFELDRVVFRSEEVALGRQSQLEQEQRRARVREVIALYFERRRLQLERDLHGDPELSRSVRIAEIEAVLDAFTKGAFGRMMRDAAWKTAVSTPVTRSPSRPRSKPQEKRWKPRRATSPRAASPFSSRSP